MSSLLIEKSESQGGATASYPQHGGLSSAGRRVAFCA